MMGKVFPQTNWLVNYTHIFAMDIFSKLFKDLFIPIKIVVDFLNFWPPSLPTTQSKIWTHVFDTYTLHAL